MNKNIDMVGKVLYLVKDISSDEECYVTVPVFVIDNSRNIEGTLIVFSKENSTIAHEWKTFNDMLHTAYHHLTGRIPILQWQIGVVYGEAFVSSNMPAYNTYRYISMFNVQEYIDRTCREVRLQELAKEIENKIAAAERQKLLKFLAEADVTAKALIDEYNELSKEELQ